MSELKGAKCIQELLTEKKKKWASIMQVHTPSWINKFGVDIKPPYLLNELEELCNEKKINLPEDLMYYLSQISREFFINMYPVEFDLSKLPSKEDIENIEIPESIIYLTSNRIDFDKLSKVMLKVGDDYENYTCIYIGLGPQYGSTWYYNDMDKIWVRKQNALMLEVFKELNNNVTNQIKI
jgi:hypothetical protein